MFQEGNQVENKVDQILDRIILSKVSTISKGNTSLSKLTELREIQKR